MDKAIDIVFSDCIGDALCALDVYVLKVKISTLCQY